ncbi:MAG: tRNA (guanosine(46)-N7)-methyltransferase TrmB [Ilumatobacteraceae bacterium]
MNPMVSPPHPPIRSFRVRRRRLSPERTALYRELTARWSLAVEGDGLQWNDVFPALQPPIDVVLDIGFGGGEALIEMAAQRPNEAVVGVDVHTNGVVVVLEAIDRNDWQHVRVVEHDVIELLPRIPVASLAGVRMFFPDPWPKTSQRNRRLARPEVIADLVDALRIGGTLHVATDIADYADQVKRLCALDSRLLGGVVPRPAWRPVTRFETRGIAEGREPIDLIYERVS